MLLETKTAIVYGAGGAIGSAVARAYAREGATVHLAGRTRSTLEEVAQRIRHGGGAAHVAQERGQGTRVQPEPAVDIDIRQLLHDPGGTAQVAADDL